MDFFAAQQRAQQKSRWLVLWFVLAVISIIVLVYLLVTLLLGYQRLPRAISLWDSERFFWIVLLAGGGIALTSLYRIAQIARHGGALIATQLGGRMIARETSDPAEKRLLNVVDEMAIAAGIPAPVVFVLDEEAGLNAFAAGLTTRDSVIGVTRGLLDAMDRDELQGVIGHETSHIVNGDSRLNLKLIGILFGIYALTIVARIFMRVRGKNAGGVVLFGLLLFLIGSIGFFCGRIIQAAVSREREYLADASAVQFTRHPSGLASALRKLQTAGSRVEHPQAAAASHLFFGASDTPAVFWASLLATHPPLTERILRLGEMPASDAEQPAEKDAPQLAIAPIATLSGKMPSASVAHTLLADLPDTLRRYAQGMIGATGIVSGLLFSNQPGIRLQQEKQLPPAALPAAQALHQWLSAQPEQGARYRLVWLDLVLPVLRAGADAERQQLLALATALIHAGGRMSPSRFALYSLLRDTLTPPSARRAKRGELRIAQLDQDIASLLALITHAGHEDAKIAAAAYQAALADSPASAPAPMPDKNALSLAAISQALSRLALATPPYRQKLLHACATAIRYDGKITPAENELLRAFAQSLDCPAPLSGYA